ncbi:MAG: uroporphyrinogen decarboxylase [Rubrimonas sp.]|uniref:uroporphyrinogen decarboxylase n=1 Tax=Rubrimonas sp. TaxID=2036015 RepID=UPI002FDE9A73
MPSHPTLLRALRGETLPRPPIWLMRQAGRYLPEYRATRAEAGSFLDLCYSPALATEVTLQPIRRYGFDAAILFADILLVPHGLGRKLWFAEGEGPRLEPLTTAADVAALADDAAMHAHLAPVYETVRRLRAALPEETALIGFAGAPWTVATYMIAGRGKDEQAGAKALMREAPDVFAALMGRLIDATTAYLEAQIDAGAQVVKLFDSWAGALVDDAAAFEAWIQEPAREIRSRLARTRPGVPIIAFPRGAGARYEAFAKAVMAEGVAIDSETPAAWARDHLQPHVAVQGNLDPALLVRGGEELDAAAEAVLDALGAGPFIFNLGHGITPDADPDNVARLVQVVRGEAGR